jgi:hypothetical protein
MEGFAPSKPTFPSGRDRAKTTAPSATRPYPICEKLPNLWLFPHLVIPPVTPSHGFDGAKPSIAESPFSFSAFPLSAFPLPHPVNPVHPVKK